MASSEIDIKQAIDDGDIVAVQQWLGSNAGKKAAAPVTPTTAARHWDVSNARPTNTKVNKPIIPSDSDPKVMETPLQYAGRKGKGAIVNELIAAGAGVDVKLNEYTQAFESTVGSLSNILNSCKQTIKGAVSLNARRVELGRFLRVIEGSASGQGSIAERISNTKEPTKSQLEVLWKEIQSFETALNAATDATEGNEARTQFLANVALLSSHSMPSVTPKPKPTPHVVLSPLQQAANVVLALADRESNPSKKRQLIQIYDAFEFHAQTGNVRPEAEECIYAKVRNLADSKPNNFPKIEYWTAILNLPVKAWDALKQLEAGWDKFRFSKIEQSKLHNLGILGKAAFRQILDEISQEVKRGRISATEYQNMLRALHTLFQSRELTPKQIQEVETTIAVAANGGLGAMMAAMTAQIFNLCPPLPARSPKVPGPVRPIGEPPNQNRFESSYKGDPKPLDPNRTDFLRKQFELKQNKVGKLDPSLLVKALLDPPKGRPRPKNLSQRADALDPAVGRSRRVGGGIIGETDPLGWKAINARAGGISSFYNAMERVYKRLQQGYKYFSSPEMELFSQVQELLKDKDYLQSIQIDGKTIWETLNPEGVGVFKVRQLVEPADGETESPLTKAIAQHKQYELEFKASLSQPGGIYNPPDKKYYIQRGADDRYHVMVKGGKTLSKKEMDEAARELIIITRDMTGNIDVNVRIHSAVSEAEAKDLAAIVLILGATVDKTANVVKEEDKHIHSVVEQHAEEMQKTASAPEFSVKKKQRELWATVRRGEMDSITQVSQKIQEKEYRVMSADGMRRMPEARNITEDDQKIYWEKKRELQTRPDWDYVDAGDIVTNVLRSVVRETSSATAAAMPEPSEGVIAHLMPLGTDVQMKFQQENLTRSKEWLEESRSQRKGQYSYDSIDSDDDILAQDKKSSSKGTEIKTTGDGNCLLHTIVLVLKARFKELQKESGYTELENAYNQENFNTLEFFLRTADQKTVENVLSPILRPLAVRWFSEDAILKKQVIENITTEWIKNLISAIRDGSLDEITAKDLKDYIDLLPPSLDLDDDLVIRIKQAAVADPDSLRAIVEDEIFPEMCQHYSDTTANLPPQIAAAAWKRLATNVSLTYTDTHGVSVTTPGASGGKNVDVKLIWSLVNDAAGSGTGHYDVQIGNAKTPAVRPQSTSETQRAPLNTFATFHPSSSTESKSTASNVHPVRLSTGPNLTQT